MGNSEERNEEALGTSRTRGSEGDLLEFGERIWVYIYGFHDVRSERAVGSAVDHVRSALRSAASRIFGSIFYQITVQQKRGRAEREREREEGTIDIVPELTRPVTERLTTPTTRTKKDSFRAQVSRQSVGPSLLALRRPMFRIGWNSSQGCVEARRRSNRRETLARAFDRVRLHSEIRIILPSPSWST